VIFDVYFIIVVLVASILCVFEIIVFNEEILLALCFFSFIFFSFNALGDSVFETFNSRASKFEEELLVSFSLSKDAAVREADSRSASRGIVSKCETLTICIMNYLGTTTSYSSYKQFSLFLASSSAKLTELSAFERKLVGSFQEKCVALLLYPLIFQTSKDNIALLTSATAGAQGGVGSSNKISILSSFSS
jgi:hypothetical protein